MPQTMATGIARHTEGEPRARADKSGDAGSYPFAIAIIVLSLLSATGLSAAYLNDQSTPPSIVAAAE
jgi:hypothetical protein